jgi:hypothetical protein
MRAARSLLILLIPVVLSACGSTGGNTGDSTGSSTQMVPVSEPPVVRQGESMLVFMRSSFVGGPLPSMVYDVSGADSRFIGFVNNGTKLAHPVKAGTYTFMVVGESADFMQATIEPGRNYYALVTPRVGVWSARFSFKPVRRHELGSAEFASWASATKYVANSPGTELRAKEKAAEVAAKRAEYWPEWNAKPPHQRESQTIKPEDGVTGALR